LSENGINEAERAIVAALAQVSIAREPQAPHRLDRMGAYVRLLAEATGVCKDPSIDRFALAARVYDVGKIGIPDRILFKAGPLTPQEFATMKTHTTAGADLLRAIERQFSGSALLAAAIAMAQDHHERFAGGGYPRGLAGSHIDFGARLIAVADVYDALTSKRCYKAPFPHERSRQIIVEQSGKQFDPAATAAFVKVEAGFAEIANTLADPV
jgi:response regulator RpfG family c-di-GMP phosphodiesterase